MHVLDPLGVQMAQTSRVRKYITAFLKFLNNTFSLFGIIMGNIDIKFVRAPMQLDANSCGAFVCAYALWLLVYGRLPTCDDSHADWEGGDRDVIRAVVGGIMMEEEVSWEVDGKEYLYKFRKLDNVREGALRAAPDAHARAECLRIINLVDEEVAVPPPEITVD